MCKIEDTITFNFFVATSMSWKRYIWSCWLFIWFYHDQKQAWKSINMLRTTLEKTTRRDTMKRKKVIKYAFCSNWLPIYDYWQLNGHLIKAILLNCASFVQTHFNQPVYQSWSFWILQSFIQLLCLGKGPYKKFLKALLKLAIFIEKVAKNVYWHVHNAISVLYAWSLS